MSAEEEALPLTSPDAGEEVRAFPFYGLELGFDPALAEPTGEEAHHLGLAAGGLGVALDPDEVLGEGDDLCLVLRVARHFLLGESFATLPALTSAAALSRSRNFWIFPDWVIGNSETTST